MLVDDSGRIEGSVTGGCVEGALVEEAHGILAGAPPRVATYGISDEQAVGVGLMCGGTVRVFVAELHAADVLAAVAGAMEDERPVALATLLDGPDAGALMAVLGDGCVAALASAATEIGYRVTIVDARQAFAQSARFSEHAEVVVAWPQEYLAGAELGPRDAILVFTHDPKFDEPALLGALGTEAGYIGALGSRRTHEDRTERLLAAGATGLEPAVAVLAEILALRAGREGGRLVEGEGPIHSRNADAPRRTAPA